MNLNEFYTAVSGDYEDVVYRLGSTKMVTKFLKKYLDNDEYPKLEEALANRQYQEAFICAHNMKGYGRNLGLTEFAEAGSEVCEALRGGEPKTDLKPLMERLESAHKTLMEAIRQLDAE